MLASILLSTLAVSLATAAPPNYSPLSFATNGSTSTPFISAAWYPGWEATNASLSSINWQKYSLISWSFAYVFPTSSFEHKRSYTYPSVTTQDPSTLSLEGSGPSFVPQFVQQAHDHGTLAGITVGGWTGSQYFSSAVTPQNRAAFIQAVLGVVDKYGFDAIDIE